MFSRYSEEILRKHKIYKRQIYSYIDNFIIITNRKLKHKKSIQELLEVLVKEGIKLSLDKCEFAVNKIVILGNLFTCIDQGATIEPSGKKEQKQYNR